MSTLALMHAVRDTLIATPSLGLTNENCRLTHQGRPFASYAGTKFVGVWYGYWRDKGSNGESLDTIHGVNVTVSVRTTQVPDDKVINEVLAKLNVGLVSICEQIVARLHVDPKNLTEGGLAYSEAMKRANDLIGNQANGFVVPPQFSDGGQPDQKGGDWWGAKGEPFGGLAQTVSLGNARRVQSIDSQT